MVGVIKHSDFRRDMGRGSLGEDITVAFFEEEFGVLADNVTKKTREWDLEVVDLDKKTKRKKKAASKTLLKKFHKNFGRTVEVKFDEAAARYNNFFIEVFFDVEKGVAGTIMKCKADLLVWVVPAGRRKFKLYLFKKPEFVAWIISYILEEKKKIKIKTPAISPHARGIPIPIKDASDSFSCLGEFEFKF